MTQAAQALAAAVRLCEFILKVDGEYAVAIEAPSIEDAQALALAEERLERATAHLQEVGDVDNQVSFEVGAWHSQQIDEVSV